jgi:hypothetical protein
MSTWDGNNFYYSGQGVVLLGTRSETGTALNLRPVGNVSSLVITVETSVLEHKESQTGNRAIDLRLTTETKCKLSMTMENFIADNLADCLRGDSTTVAAGTTVAGVVDGGTVGTVSSLGVIGLTAATITGKTIDVDYEINLEAGSVKWLTDQSANLNIVTSLTYAAHEVVDPLVNGFTELYMRFEGLNTADSNKPVVVEIFKFSTDPLKELALISDGVQQFVLEGNVLADPLQTSGSKFFKVMMQR